MSFSVRSDPRQPEVHASTLLLAGNKLLSAWFGGTKEGFPDTKIWLSTRDLSLTEPSWSESHPVAFEEGLAHWNPVLIEPRDLGTILLFYKVGSPISTWRTRVIESIDGGVNWSKARELVPGDIGGRGPVKNKPVVLADGTILAPSSIESPEGKWDCFADISSDNGKTWQRSDLVPIDRLNWPGEGCIQPSLIDEGSGKVTMLTRSSAGYVARSDSEDNGRSWGQMYLTPLFNNNSGIDALRLGDGTWLVVHNPIQQRWGPRTPLVVSRSVNEGKSWSTAMILEDKPAPRGFSGIVARDTGIVNDGESEFSYPAIIADGLGGCFISYTYERTGIKHVHLDASQFL